MSRARRGLLKLASSAGLGQAALLLATPLLTRIYRPDQLGTLTMIVAVAAVLAGVAAFRLEGAIALVPASDDAQSLTRLCILLGLGTATGTAVVVLILRATGAVAVPAVWAWALPLLVLQGSWFATFSQLAFRQRSYGAVASRTLVQTLASVVGQVAGGLVHAATATLVGVQVLARFLGVVGLSRLDSGWRNSPQAGTYGGLVTRYRRFPSVFAPSALLNALTLAVPVLFLGFQFGATVAGQIGIAQRIVAAPLALVGSAVAQVFLAEIASRVRNGVTANRSIFLRASGYLLAAGLLMSAMMAALGAFMIPRLLGPGWEMAGDMIVVMALPALFQFVSTPLSGVFIAYEAAKANVSLDLLRGALLATAAFAVTGFSLGPVLGTFLLFGSVAVVYALAWVVGLRLVSQVR